ncbi:MAG: GTP-binding protein [Okeania sp. SIO3I5]|uniref:CobW family GTP-binding protein n=1 Tax=Okeania sp. SIO3I5 TaxID=2607805 RepID=UPI0013BC19E5|nr:GTP-binding protein [Okeania sp. SIO3I5]NEQ39711.1 GTP-binding protein [Okeania sp. SIO3I5]
MNNSLQLDIPKRGMPVTIITGFLGSGKTTLINQILQNKQNLKVAILVNEFGDINIDSQLLVDINDNMLELSNGCICCTINDGLVDAVYQILERDEKIDYLIIETTGLADPLPIMLTFLGTDLKDLTYLDSVLTLVDCENFTPDHFDSEAAIKQIVYGDIILLNKTDLVSQDRVDDLESYIKTVNNAARILRSEYSKIPFYLILDVNLSKLQPYLIEDKNYQYELQRKTQNHLINDGFTSISFRSERPFSMLKFQHNFLEELPENIFRAKGILWFQESESKHIFQLSGKRYDLQVEEWLTTPTNQLVLIGRDLNPLMIQQSLTNCLTV